MTYIIRKINGKIKVCLKAHPCICINHITKEFALKIIRENKKHKSKNKNKN